MTNSLIPTTLSPMIDRNPFKVLREEHDWTQDSLTQKIGCSKVLIIRTEQGCYPDPPTTIMEFWLKDPRVVEVLRPDPVTLRVTYREFQKHTRMENYGKLWEKFDFDKVEGTVHPFVAWRLSTNLNPTQVCKYFCVHPATLYKLESQHYTMNDLPQPLVDALLESGYSEATIESLRSSFRQFKKNYSATVKVTQPGDRS